MGLYFRVALLSTRRAWNGRNAASPKASEPRQPTRNRESKSKSDGASGTIAKGAKRFYPKFRIVSRGAGSNTGSTNAGGSRSSGAKRSYSRNADVTRRNFGKERVEPRPKTKGSTELGES